MSISPSIPQSAARAHALKNCLNIIAAVNHLVERELGEVARQRLSRSREAVHRMVALINEDLAPGSVSAPAQEFVPAERVAKAVALRVEDRAAVAQVQMFFKCGAGGVVGDARALTEALGNVVLNAIEATPPGGSVSVATYECRDGSQLWTVQDTGRGISPDLVARLGQPFASAREGGSGIGIAFARDVIERHAGFTRIESWPNMGTRVSIWFSRQRTMVVIEPATPSSAPTGNEAA